MSAANITNSLLSAVLFMYLARTLSVEVFGYLSYAGAFAFYFVNFIDLGLSTFGMREVARNRSRATELVSQIVSFRFVLACVLYAVSILIALSLYHHPPILRLLIVESALLVFTTALATEWAFQGLEKMHMVFISFATTACFQLGLVYLFVKSPQDVLKVPIIYFLATLPVIAIFLRRLKYRFPIRQFDMASMRLYLSSSLIIWMISLCVQTYNNLDVVILGIFRDAAEVGYFSVARRFAGAISALMVFLANAVLPHMASTFHAETARFHSATRAFLRLSAGITVFALIPLLFLSKPLITMTVGPQYIPARLPFDILVAALALVLFNMPFSTGLIATGHERDVLKQAAACALCSIVSNFILVPRYGMIGAAASFFLVETLAIFWVLWVYRKRIGFGSLFS